jgi:predicted transposase YbfD/YdcC
MDIRLNLDSLKDLENQNVKVDAIKFQKMLLLYNSIEQGWSVKKRDDSYVFSKQHENKKEVLEDSYLLKFMKTNLDLNKIIS